MTNPDRSSQMTDVHRKLKAGIVRVQTNGFHEQSQQPVVTRHRERSRGEQGSDLLRHCRDVTLARLPTGWQASRTCLKIL